MKKIIVPVDFSEHSNYALEAAAILARQNNAEVLALHMLEISDAILTKTDNEQQAKAAFFLKLAEKRFNQFLDKDFLNDINVTPIVKHFKVFSEVNEVAKEHDADMIVMGSHGSSGLSEIFLGSNTEKVVRHSNIPVLVLKSKPESLEFKNVVLACDFAEDSVDGYHKALKMFSTIGTKLHLLYVNLPTDSFKSSIEIDERISNFLMKADGNLNGMDRVNIISDYTVEKGIFNFANKIEADIIAITTHGRKGIAHFFEGSISENIANHSVLPVMTFKL